MINLRMRSQSDKTSTESEIESVDSSLLCSMISKTCSIQPSQNQSNTQLLQFTSPQIIPQHSNSPIQNLRKQNRTQTQNLQPFIGFFVGGNKKPVILSKSKLQLAEKMMGDSPSSEKHPKQLERLQLQTKTQLQLQQFQPIFKTGGNKEVKITPQIIQKIQNFINFEPYIETKKLKKDRQSKPNITHTNIVTMSVKKIKKRLPQSKQAIEQKKQGLIKKLKEIKFQQPSGHLQVLTLDKLKHIDYPIKQFLQYNPFHEFQHQIHNCSTISCFFCSCKWQRSCITKEDILNIVKDRTTRQIPGQICQTYYDCVCFKLFRYTCLFPQIINKRINPTNLSLELIKKINKYIYGYKGYLNKCLENPKGQQIKLIIRTIIYSQSLSTYYIKLSDGWSYVWGVIQPHNQLHRFMRKMCIGMKIQIVGWVIHPINNIIQYAGLKDESNVCIQFYYNGSKIIDYNNKLGRSKESFYRPINKCRMNGGLVPLVKGIIIRMFTSKLKKNKHQGGYHSNMAEIILDNGQNYFIQINLPSEVSLAELYQLYHSYYFTKLKILEDRCLLFSGQSKYIDISDQSKSLIVQNILKSRIPSKVLISGMRYDLIPKDGLYYMEGVAIEIESASSQFVFYQQYIFNQQINKFVRDRFSSNLKHLPKIYQRINSE